MIQRRTADGSYVQLLEQKHGAFSPEQREIMRAIELQGSIRPPQAQKNGWTHAHQSGLPKEALRNLIARKIVAPRVETSQPLKMLWQLRSEADRPDVLAKIAAEASRLKVKEYAEGGYKLELRRELRGKAL